MLIEPVHNLRGRLPLRIHSENRLDGLCAYWLYLILPISPYFIPKTRTTHSDTMQSVFFKTSLDTSGEIFGVIFGIPLKYRFQNDSLWRVRHGLFRIKDLDPIFLELGLVDS